MIKQINEQLELLERELSQMKSVTEYAKDTNENSVLVLSELKQLHQSYATVSEKIFTLYRETVDVIQTETSRSVNASMSRITEVGNQIEQVSEKKFVEINKLLESYQKTLDSTDKLVANLESLDVKSQLSELNQNTTTNSDILLKRFVELDGAILDRLSRLETILISVGEVQGSLLKSNMDNGFETLVNRLNVVEVGLSKKADEQQEYLIRQFESQDKVLGQLKLFLYGIIAINLCVVVLGILK